MKDDALGEPVPGNMRKAEHFTGKYFAREKKGIEKRKFNLHY